MSKKNYVYKLSPTNFRVMQESLSVKQSLTYENVTGPQANSLAYDYDNNTLFFIKSNLKLYYIQSGDSVATEVSGFTSPTGQPANAAYHNGAIWYFEFNSNVLVKLTLTYAGGVPSVSGKTTYTVTGMNLPSAGVVGPNTNAFGDIAINNNTGVLYASTSRGRFYSVNLSNPAGTFSEIVSSPGNDRSVGLQLAYNNAANVLYGHNHKSGNWYTINTSTGVKTGLSLSTSLFRDIAGNSTTMYGNDKNGDIYTIDITLSTPSTLDQFFLPKSTDAIGLDNLGIDIQTDSFDQSFRIGFFNNTSDMNVKVDWGDKTTATYLSEGYQEHVYEGIFDGTINIQGNLGGGEIRIGGKPKPININGSWSNDYSNLDIVDGVTAIEGITSLSLSSIKLTNLRNLTSVPSDFFDNVTSSVTNLDYTFENTGLTSIPSSLLTSMSNVSSYVATFRDCDSITSVPIPFFSVHTGITDMSHFLDYTEIDNYDNFLDWLYTQANSINLTGVTLGACGNAVSNATGTSARTNLINNLSWTIVDGPCSSPPPTATPTATPTSTPAVTATATPGSTETPSEPAVTATATPGSTPTGS